MQVPYQIYYLQFFSLPFCGLSSYFFVSFEAQNYLILIKSNLVFSFVVFAFGVISSLTQGNEDLFLFSSKSFIVLGVSFSSMIHCELIFVYGVTSQRQKGLQLIG